MTRGGPRNRAGLPPDPKSARSERLGRRFGKLPRSGYSGPLPRWPLSKVSARERVVWREAWRTPQATAWATEPWRHRSVAMYVRLSVRLERPDSPTTLAQAVIRFSDQIGLTPAGLRENGWEIEEAPSSSGAAPVPVEPEVVGAPEPPPSVPLRDRLRVVTGAGG